MKILAGISFALFALFTTNALAEKSIDQKANELYVSAFQNLKAAKTADDLVQKVDLLRQAKTSLETILSNYSGSNIAVKLITDDKSSLSIQEISNRIFRLTTTWDWCLTFPPEYFDKCGLNLALASFAPLRRDNSTDTYMLMKILKLFAQHKDKNTVLKFADNITKLTTDTYVLYKLVTYIAHVDGYETVSRYVDKYTQLADQPEILYQTAVISAAFDGEWSYVKKFRSKILESQPRFETDQQILTDFFLRHRYKDAERYIEIHEDLAGFAPLISVAQLATENNLDKAFTLTETLPERVKELAYMALLSNAIQAKDTHTAIKVLSTHSFSYPWSYDFKSLTDLADQMTKSGELETLEGIVKYVHPERIDMVRRILAVALYKSGDLKKAVTYPIKSLEMIQQKFGFQDLAFEAAKRKSKKDVDFIRDKYPYSDKTSLFVNIMRGYIEAGDERNAHMYHDLIINEYDKENARIELAYMYRKSGNLKKAVQIIQTMEKKDFRIDAILKIAAHEVDPL